MEAAKQPAESGAFSPVPRGLEAVSPSKLNDFQCPYRYQQVHVKGVEEPEEPPLELGNLSHHVAAGYFDHLQNTGASSDHARLQETADAAWRFRSHAVLEGLRPTFFGFVDALRGYVIPEGDKILGVESRIAFNERWERVAWDDPAAAYGGMLDLIHGNTQRLTIVDWTTAALGAQFQVKKDLQVRLYGLLAWKHTKGRIPSIRCQVRSLRTGAVHELELGPEDHEETETRVREERGRILEQLTVEEDWPAMPSSACAICKLSCPYEADYEEEHGDMPLLRIQSAGQAQILHRELIRLEARRKQILGPLKAYVGVYGPVESGGIEATYRTSLTHEYPTADVYAALVGAGYPASLALDIFSVNRKRLNKCLKGNGDLLLAVEALAKVKTQERFNGTASVRAEGDDDDE